MTADLRRHLLDSRISGEVDTSRESNLRNIDRMLAGADGAWFGLTHSRDWSAAEVLQVMVEQVGIRADPAYRSGTDTIDPDLTIAALVRWRERLELAVRRRERVLIATGHPSGVFQLHLDVAAALELRERRAVRLRGQRELADPGDREGIDDAEGHGEDQHRAYRCPGLAKFHGVLLAAGRRGFVRTRG